LPRESAENGANETQSFSKTLSQSSKEICKWPDLHPPLDHRMGRILTRTLHLWSNVHLITRMEMIATSVICWHEKDWRVNTILRALDAQNSLSSRKYEEKGIE
jgi:hypothetical protein